MLLTFVTVGHGSILQGTSKYTNFENITVNIDVEAVVWKFLALKLRTCYTVSYTTYKYYKVYIRNCVHVCKLELGNMSVLN